MKQMISKRKIKILRVIWLLTWPVMVWLSYNYSYINVEGHLIDILLFAIFMCIVALFPLRINHNHIFFVTGISIPAFLSFGLFIEFILSQLAITTVLIKLKVDKKGLFRYPLNMLIFGAVSLTGAFVFWVLGGNQEETHYDSLTGLIPIFGYVGATFIANLFLTKLAQRILLQKNTKIFDRGLLWELASSLLVIPVGFVLYVLYSEIGREAIFYLGIPFVCISVILMLLYSFQEINYYLKRTAEIGHQLTKRLEVNEVYDVFVSELGHLLHMDYAVVYSVVNDQYLKLVRFVDMKRDTNLPFEFLDVNEAFSGKVWASKSPIMYNSSKEWRSINHQKIPKDAESVLSLPVEYGDGIVGVITIISTKKKAFEKSHYRILDILTNYLGVAIENAKNYEETKTKSERDGLTQLYNYRYFENELNNYFRDLPVWNQTEMASLILLDLDHFKAINDTYGHEAGNEILCQVANRLIVKFGDFGLIARYGGEEFVVFLPQVDVHQAANLAETLRATIADVSFPIENHILNHNEITEVNVTTSIGVATYPTHCDTPGELIRHADRAMYIGAKSKGRNKVAVYEEHQTI